VTGFSFDDKKRIVSHHKIDLRIAKLIWFSKKGCLDRMFGRWCGGLDDHGRDRNCELDHDRDHNK
jgi:hypothetical protein